MAAELLFDLLGNKSFHEEEVVMGNLKPATIFIIDDNAVERRVVKRSLNIEKIGNNVKEAEHGEQAMEMLVNGEVPKPFIILLDINMPRMNGHEFLEQLRQNDDYQDSVVFVLSTSGDKIDRDKAYGQNVAGYITKENAGEDFSNMIKLIKEYQMIVELPE